MKKESNSFFAETGSIKMNETQEIYNDYEQSVKSRVSIFFVCQQVLKNFNSVFIGIYFFIVLQVL